MAENDLKIGTNAMYDGGGASSGRFFSPDVVQSIARVSFVLLDDSNKAKFNELGGWRSIGAVECKTFINNSNPEAKPIIAFPNRTSLNHYPLVNELVLITQNVSYNAQGGVNNYEPRYYYTTVIPTQNSIEHNATPDETFFKNGEERVTGDFNEKGDINRKIKAPGDLTLEGRSGHSIRLGASIDKFNSPFLGPDRSPLVVISNNHHKSTNSKIANFEDINKDGSSLFMLNKHNVGFEPSSFNFDSYGEDVAKTVKSNYVEPTVVADAAPNVESSTNSNDQKINTVVDTTPIIRPVEAITEAIETNRVSEDESRLPSAESDEEYVSETEYVNFTEQITQYNNLLEDNSNRVETNVANIPTVYTKTIGLTSTVTIGKDPVSLPKKIAQDKRFKNFIAKPGVHDKVKSICLNKGCSIESLYIIMYAESGFQTKITNSVRATGLIQFMPKTAQNLGTTVEKLATMDELTQLDYVAKYFSGTNKKLVDVYDLYMYTFFPIAVGKPLNWVIQSKGLSAELISKQNPAIARAAGKKAGVPLTKYDFYKYVDSLLKAKI